jgi:NTE family protein
MIELARLMIVRSRQVARRGPVGDPSVFGFVPPAVPGPIRPVVERIRARDRRPRATRSPSSGPKPPRAHRVVLRGRAHHDFVLYVPSATRRRGRAFVPRQVDRLFQVGRGDRTPGRAAAGRAPAAAATSSWST